MTCHYEQGRADALVGRASILDLGDVRAYLDIKRTDDYGAIVRDYERGYSSVEVSP